MYLYVCFSGLIGKHKHKSDSNHTNNTKKTKNKKTKLKRQATEHKTHLIPFHCLSFSHCWELLPLMLQSYLYLYLLITFDCVLVFVHALLTVWLLCFLSLLLFLSRLVFFIVYSQCCLQLNVLRSLILAMYFMIFCFSKFVSFFFLVVFLCALSQSIFCAVFG